MRLFDYSTIRLSTIISIMTIKSHEIPSRPRASDVRRALRDAADPVKAKGLQRFFKTGKGDYGEGDRFLGVMVPIQRSIVKRFRRMSIGEATKLLHSPYHEERLTALLLLVDRYGRGMQDEKERIYKTYLANTRWINNWDLVDLSAPNIVGQHLVERPRSILRRLARSRNLWERRIAIISTATFIRQNDFDDTLEIGEMLLRDRHDLIHKAVGWMLREVGKRDRKTLDSFLNTHRVHLPRTALRYAIERHSAKERKRYLAR
jgi:3-methyladenine DNA glycosylase AlkD